MSCKKRIRLLPLLFLCLIASLQVEAKDWMSRLSDATPLTMVSIPGSHDAATGNGFTSEFDRYAARFARTQAIPLSQQWAAGTRAFDLRPAVVEENGNSSLHIFHGVVKTNASFEYAIKMLIDSVTTHNTEFAVVIMRHETDGDRGNSKWEKLMKEFLNRDDIKKHIVNYSPSLTVKDLRGKILVLSRVNYDVSPVGGYIENWTSEEDINAQKAVKVRGTKDTGSLYVQDYYETTSKKKMKTKLANIVRMLRISQARVSLTDNPLIINHTSGFAQLDSIDGYQAATSDGYRKNAQRTNSKVIKYLKKHKGPTGIIMMDFSGVNKSGRFKVNGKKLTNKIIKQNFK